MREQTGCRHFKGDIPCRPHKEHGVKCGKCKYYSGVNFKILIIKLGAIGDVIRTTPLITKLKEVYPSSEIHWLTHSPEVIPAAVDKAIKWEFNNIMAVSGTPYDLVLNLDKDKEACALAVKVKARGKKGFILKDGKCAPADRKALHKWLTGLWDDDNRANTKSYQEEIFEICGYKFEGQKYIFELKEKVDWKLNAAGALIGLNTGCGPRWRTRLWSTANWVDLAKKIKALGYGVILLGGEAEDERNRQISLEAGVSYPGHFPLPKFFSLVNECDVIVTPVSMAMHVAIGLGKKVVVMNNIFNKHEFELYGRGLIVEPDLKCLGCFKPEFDKACPVNNCMDMVKPEEVLGKIKSLVQPVHPAGR